MLGGAELFDVVLDGGDRDSAGAADVHNGEVAAGDEFVGRGSSDGEHAPGVDDGEQQRLDGFGVGSVVHWLLKAFFESRSGRIRKKNSWPGRKFWPIRV